MVHWDKPIIETHTPPHSKLAFPNFPSRHSRFVIAGTRPPLVSHHRHVKQEHATAGQECEYTQSALPPHRTPLPPQPSGAQSPARNSRQHPPPPFPLGKGNTMPPPRVCRRDKWLEQVVEPTTREMEGRERKKKRDVGNREEEGMEPTALSTSPLETRRRGDRGGIGEMKERWA